MQDVDLFSASVEFGIRIGLNLIGISVIAWGWSPAARFWSRRFSGTNLSPGRSWLVAFLGLLIWTCASAGTEVLVRTATSLEFGDFALAWRGWTTFAGGFGLALLVTPVIIRRVVVTTSKLELSYRPRLKIVFGTLGPLFALAVVIGAAWQWIYFPKL